MSRPRLVTAVIASLIAMPSAARAQAPPPNPPVEEPAEKQDTDKQEARPTGLPPRIVWTVNFDAGWGTFGFANSLFDNPKEAGVDDNLSDQWFEGYVKPALSGSYR